MYAVFICVLILEYSFPILFLYYATSVCVTMPHESLSADLLLEFSRNKYCEVFKGRVIINYQTSQSNSCVKIGILLVDDYYESHEGQMKHFLKGFTVQFKELKAGNLASVKGALEDNLSKAEKVNLLEGKFKKMEENFSKVEENFNKVKLK